MPKPKTQNAEVNPLVSWVIKPLFSAALLGAVAIIINFLTHGGLIRAMGGLTDADAIAAGALPYGTVVIVDDNRGCPKGWASLGNEEPGVFAGHAIVGVGGKTAYRHTGDGSITLNIAQIPPHSHPVAFKEKLITLPADAIRFPELPIRRGEALKVLVADGDDGKRKMIATGQTPKPVEVTGPFVGLYLCKKR